MKGNSSVRSQDTWALVCSVPITAHNASLRVSKASATVALTVERLVTGIQNKKRLKFLERLAIHISKSKAWMVKGADGCAICKQIHSNNGAWALVASKRVELPCWHRKMTTVWQNPQETSPNENGQNMWGFLLWDGSGARLPCMLRLPQLEFPSQKQHYHDTCLLNTS